MTADHHDKVIDQSWYSNDIYYLQNASLWQQTHIPLVLAWEKFFLLSSDSLIPFADSAPGIEMIIYLYNTKGCH